jgi:hypothetical protein
MTASTPESHRPLSAATPGPTLPEFFIVGQPKCGTTALHEMLSLHPQVFMPSHKEPNFFIRDGRYKNTPPSLGDYLALFSGATPGQRCGEASVLYLASGTSAAGIAELQPAAKTIAILREPARLLRSFHLEMLEKRVETEKDLRRALALEASRRASHEVPADGIDEAPMLFYSSHVRYVEQLERFYDRFPAEQILVLLYDDFRQDNRATLRRILRFLDVDDSVDLDVKKANPTVQVRSPALDRMVHALEMGNGTAARLAKRAVKAVTPRKFRRRTLDGLEKKLVYAEPPQVDQTLMAELRETYRPEVEALDDYLGAQLNVLSRWGYR